MQDLQQITHEIHYENYRTEKLQLKKYLINEEQQKKLIEEKDQEVMYKFDFTLITNGHVQFILASSNARYAY